MYIVGLVLGCALGVIVTILARACIDYRAGLTQSRGRHGRDS